MAHLCFFFALNFKQSCTMTIKDVKVTMSRIGITSSDTPRKIMYMPIAKISYNESKKSFTKFLDGTFVKKDHFQGYIIGKAYFVGITKDEYLIYNEVGERIGSVKIETVGRPIEAHEEYFVCLKDKTISGINPKGEIIATKELSDNELKNLTS